MRGWRVVCGCGGSKTSTIATGKMCTIATECVRRPKTSTIATGKMCTIATRAVACAWWRALGWGAVGGGALRLRPRYGVR